MNDATCEFIRRHFDGRLSEYGCDDPRGVLWGTLDSQESRFEILAEVGPLRGASLLDVGCGVGDLWRYLSRQGIACDGYLGVDVNPQMIEAARRKYPNAAFEVRDIVNHPFEEEQFDYVCESGIFNVAIPDWEQVTFETLRQMFRSCRKALAANFLSCLSGNRNPEARYCSPMEIVEFISGALSDKFVLRHDYRTNDFTVYVYKHE